MTDSKDAKAYSLKTGKTGEKILGAYQKLETGVTEGYQRMEDKFVDRFLERDPEGGLPTMKVGKLGERLIDGYRAIEKGVVGAYQKIEDKFVDRFLESKGPDQGPDQEPDQDPDQDPGPDDRIPGR